MSLLTPVPAATTPRRVGSPWPASARAIAGDLRVSGVPLADVATKHGTPVHVLDEDEFRSVPAPTATCSVGTACTSLRSPSAAALVGWLAEEGIGMDVCSAGEVRTALDGGPPGRRMLLHGDAESAADLQTAIAAGVMSDNPRPALYGEQYAPRLVGRDAAAAQRTVTVVGRHCESGDVLAADVSLPADTRPGDLPAAPAAGADHLSMASNDNAVPRPPVVAVRGGEARLLVRREALEDLGRRDVGR